MSKKLLVDALLLTVLTTKSRDLPNSDDRSNEFVSVTVSSFIVWCPRLVVCPIFPLILLLLVCSYAPSLIRVVGGQLQHVVRT